MKQEKSPKNRNIWGILAALFAVAALACIILFIKSEIDSKKMADDMSSLAKVAPSGESGEASEPSESASSVEESSDEASQPAETEPPMDPFEKSVKLAEDAGVPIPDLEVDIQKLQETENPDIYAWIYIPGTKVNYPVLQHPTDDTYYLNYNIDGSKGLPGCIFSEKAYNGKDFSDHNTVLYGHNMKNGTMFGCLHKYEDMQYYIYMIPNTGLHLVHFASLSNQFLFQDAYILLKI